MEGRFIVVGVLLGVAGVDFILWCCNYWIIFIFILMLCLNLFVTLGYFLFLI